MSYCKKRPKCSSHRLIANVETYMNWNFGADNFTSRYRHVNIQVLRCTKLFVLIRILLFSCFLAVFMTEISQFRALRCLKIFLIEVFIDLELKKVGNCVGDEVSHNMFDSKVIQTKWLLLIATHTLNDCMFEFVVTEFFLTRGSFANLRHFNLSLQTKIFIFIKLQKGVKSREPAQEVCYVNLANSFLLFD